MAIRHSEKNGMSNFESHDLGSKNFEWFKICRKLVNQVGYMILHSDLAKHSLIKIYMIFTKKEFLLAIFEHLERNIVLVLHGLKKL